jgi:hypothetical protein
MKYHRKNFDSETRKKIPKRKSKIKMGAAGIRKMSYRNKDEHGKDRIRQTDEEAWLLDS